MKGQFTAAASLPNLPEVGVGSVTLRMSGFPFRGSDLRFPAEIVEMSRLGRSNLRRIVVRSSIL